jgi:hypothetical protein
MIEGLPWDLPCSIEQLKSIDERRKTKKDKLCSQLPREDPSGLREPHHNGQLLLEKKRGSLKIGRWLMTHKLFLSLSSL